MEAHSATPAMAAAGGEMVVAPPHKHDAAARPRETLLEETYYHRTEPAQGFGPQRVYTDDRSAPERAWAVDNDPDHEWTLAPEPAPH